MTPPRHNIYFISDLHLGADYLVPARDYEDRVVRFLESIRHDAAELYMLGDILDYWYEYRTVVPRGYIRFFGALARLADSGVKIYWFIGNHDIWLFDYLRDEIGITIIDGVLEKEIYGKYFFMSHGDGVGEMPATFRAMRNLFRSPVAQKLYAAIHPRWTIPFAHRWSKSSRGYTPHPTVTANAEAEPLVKFSQSWLTSHPDINYFVFGHRHIMLDKEISPTCRTVILGDWIHHFSYAGFDGDTLSLHRFKS
ncbi:MAG: UDP-2,3-diacylglucosamine diphosphatase, partial [Muribaculum sp.]|nr:UDP-2,3-diacylglucosamine diphosphatase [Muribaculum sp.]